MVRTPCCDKSGLKKGTWTPEEDRKLIAYVSRYGCWNWRQLPRFAGLQRCGKSCRLRWMNYLRPNIKRGNYTKEEEETIIRLHQSLGNRWSAIAAELPGRTDNEVKNHWHTNLKKRVQHNYVTHGLEKYSNNSSNGNNIPSQEKTKDNIVSEHNNDALEDQAALQILESSTLSPGQTYSSSDEVSTISTDTTFTETSTTNFAADDSNVSAYNSLETFSEFSGNFWTEPFLADNSYIPSEFLTPITDLEIFSPVFDGSPLSSTHEYYMAHEVLF